MKKLIFIILLIFAAFCLLPKESIFAEQCVSDCTDLDDCTKKISECRKAWEMMEQAKKPHEDSLRKMDADIKSFQNRIGEIQQELVVKEEQIKQEEKDLGNQEELLAKRVHAHYVKSYYATPFLTFFSQKNASLVFKQLVFYQAVTEQNKNAIIQIIGTIKNLQTKKKNLEGEKIALAALEKETDQKAESVRILLAEASSYQSKVEGTITTLTSRQQEILAAKTSLFSTSVGDVPLADDPASRPDFNPGFSPAFAAFSFGAPHFRGMSQYGAFGRAKEGQSYEQILRAYYGGGIEIRDHNPDASIMVDGYGTYSLEEYAKRIYEMPGSWGDEGGMEALKAQAIAARSYALARGGSICATESCQVFKPESKGGKWEEAVNQTRGKVVYANGSPLSTWYASTSGGYQESYTSNGYTTPGLWDTKNGRSGWTSEAYEKIAGSPWFYKAWYKTRSGVSCGRSHPWLTGEEFADIVNAAIVLQEGGDVSGIFPPDVQSCFGGGDNPWSRERMKEEANKHGGGLSSVSSVSVIYTDSGYTAKITINGRELDGATFKKAFNLRAPGALNLKSGLYNIEKK